MLSRRIKLQRTMYIKLWCANFKKFCLKLVHKTVVFEVFRSCATLYSSYCFTVFYLCPFFHHTLVLGTWTNCYRSFFWPLTKSAAKHLDNIYNDVMWNSLWYNLHSKNNVYASICMVLSFIPGCWKKKKWTCLNTYQWNYLQKEHYGKGKSRCIKVHLHSQNRRASRLLYLLKFRSIFQWKRNIKKLRSSYLDNKKSVFVISIICFCNWN